MLITVSGMVGSGKSTSVRRIERVLEACGADATFMRFRSLGIFASGQTESPKRPKPSRAATPPGTRWRGFRPRRLTARLTCGYILRVLAFRLRRIGRSSGYTVLDRYFYDSFVHYKLTTPRERLYLRILGRLIPRPDLAILLIASPVTIAARRPEYAGEYVVAATAGYERLKVVFPHLIAIRTDGDEAGGDTLAALVHEYCLRMAPVATAERHEGIS